MESREAGTRRESCAGRRRSGPKLPIGRRGRSPATGLQVRRLATAATAPGDLAGSFDLNLAGMRWFFR
ncbi:MAG: hypothetical protein CMJ54_09635 [Planctomycetaceae bacterium]|nr:hypothetical protein [Planctomycetaceae bacterium]